jgi:DNA-binding response OmpR family regulator
MTWYDISLRMDMKMTKRVMIVDDEPDILSSLKSILEKNDYDVITVTNGIECVKEIEKGFKGVILLDLMMPEMDGWETINEILKRGLMNNVAISIITGKGTKDFQHMCSLGSYIFDYIVKPLDINKLILSIEKCNENFFSKNT